MIYKIFLKRIISIFQMKYFLSDQNLNEFNYLYLFLSYEKLYCYQYNFNHEIDKNTNNS